MFKKFILIFLCLWFNFALAKNVSLEVLAKQADVSAEINEEQLLLLNGFRQSVTRELEEFKLDSALYWNKLEKRKMSPKEEFLFLKTFFSNELVAQAAPPNPKENSKEPKNVKDESQPLSGTFSAALDDEKLKQSYQEVINDLGDTKLKTFYLISNIDLDKSMTWEDLGVTKAESFVGVILDSWKKLFEKELKGFDRVVVLDKDFSNKPDYMNSKSVTLKWKSILKKTSFNADTQTAVYELNAQYILQNSKSGTILTALDFPEQKRALDDKNKKALSSNLASLIYNLLFSQTSKIQDLLAADAKAVPMSEIEIKVLSKTSLTEIFQVNNLLQEKFKDLKLTSHMKSYANDGASITIRAEGTVDNILDNLSKDGGKFPLNEQKVLLFNRADKTFAILPKESNN